jgi:REP element-mobilizing transposase RayT
MFGIVKNKNSFLYRINGIEDHIHMLVDLHPNYALADFMREIKTSSSIWVKQSGKFSNFEGWADGYAALTYSYRDKDMIVNYIKNQQEHHYKESFEAELRRLLKENGIEIDEKYFP